MDVFSQNGVLAKNFPNYTVRNSQIKFTKKVLEAFKKMHRILVEAPTGTGKTFGYSIPAIFSPRQTIIATSNIALQEQLIKKDLPELRKVFKKPFSYSILKGRSNYGCYFKLEDVPDVSLDADNIELYLNWLKRSDGDRGNMPNIPNGDWGLICSDSVDCINKKCDHFEYCPYFSAKRKAERSKIVVINHHLLASICLMDENLPLNFENSNLVIDEAHAFEDAIRSVSSAEVTKGVFEHIRAKVFSTHSKIGSRIAVNGKKWMSQIAELIKDDNRIRVLSKEDIPDPGSLLLDLEELSKITVSKRIYKLVKEVAASVRETCTQDNPNRVVYLEEDKNKKPVLRISSIKVSDHIKPIMSASSIVFTSATLELGGSYDYFIKTYGVPDPKTITMKENFDYAKNSILYIPNMRAPNEKDWFRDLEKRTLELIRLCGGRTLFLSTSHKVSKSIYSSLVGKFDDVLLQGQESRTKLLKRFREVETSILIGTDSFWTGVDVPGPALSCVIIDKLPFLRIDDPILNSYGDEGFFTYSIPKALLKFKQGFGRLIRKEDDTGVVALMDPRVLTKGYGRRFMDCLPDMSYTRTLADIKPYIGE